MNEYTYSEINLGMEASFERKITDEMMNAFRSISGDVNPLHSDDEYARSVLDGRFPSHVCYGMLTASFYSTLGGCFLPGKYSLIHSVDSLKLLNPVFVGDKLTVHGVVIDKQDDLRLIVVKADIQNQNSKYVSKAKMKILVLK